MKIYDLSSTIIVFPLMILVLFLITGCGKEVPLPEPIYVTHTEKVYVTVPCESEVKVRCDWSSDDDKTVIQKMMICISDLKLRDESCSKDALVKHRDLIKAIKDKNVTK